MNDTDTAAIDTAADDQVSPPAPAKKPVITRGSILGAAARHMGGAPTPITVPELGGLIYVRGLTGHERDAFEDSIRIRKGIGKGENDMTNFRARLCVHLIVDQDGRALLSDEDADMLGELPVRVLDKIINESNRLSAISEEEVEDLGKGSASRGTSVASASTSREN